MFLRSLFACLVCFASGIGVAAGTFAFLLMIKVLPRMIQKAKLRKHVIYLENMVVKGVLFGTLLSLLYWKKKWLFELLGKTLLSFYGISAGIFTGCTAVALAEILDTFPIFFRRLNIKGERNNELIFIMAVGKMVGSLFYFFGGYGMISGT